MSEVIELLVWLFAVAGWLLYFRENKKSRDYATDLSQVIHDYPESTDSLRRSLEWDEINNRVNQEWSGNE